jgi:YVTN family beta-propeller protein
MRIGPEKRWPRRRSRMFVAAALATLVIDGGIASAAATDPFGTHRVGEVTGLGLLLPSNQLVDPIGERHLVTNGKLLSSSPSPDGRFLAALTAGRSVALTIFDLQTGAIVQQAGTSPSVAVHISSDNVGQEGPFYSPDGRTLWMPQSRGFECFAVSPADGTLSGLAFVRIPNRAPTPAGTLPVPAGAAFSSDGSTLYVALNGQNALAVVNVDPARPCTTIGPWQRYPVGNAPRQVQLIGRKAYVSNEGGRPAGGGDFALNSYGTAMVSDPITGAATTGTVSVVDFDHGGVTSSIDVGLHPTALYRHGDALFVTNTGSDSVSIIDTTSDQVVQTFDTSPLPGENAGYHPNAVVMPDDGHVLVSLARANALAVYRYEGPQKPVSYEGLLPTDYYPAELTLDPNRRDVVVTNERGIGAGGPTSTIDKGPGTHPATGHNTFDVTGSLTIFPMPAESHLRRWTRKVFRQNNWRHSPVESEPGSSDVAPRPVPKRIGELSPIKHVFLVIKENRTYDQVLGDMRNGDGDPSLAQFGDRVTPNMHALSSQFTLFDNAYNIGTNSPEGHNWLMEADNPEYVESQFGEYQRSYDSFDDALGHQRGGFLWTAAAAAGQATRVYGEYNPFMTGPTPRPSWSDWYCDSQILEGKAQGPLPVPIDAYQTHSPMPALNTITDHQFPRYDLSVPDQYRVDMWLSEFQQFEQTGDLPNLNLIWLPADHTSGLSPSLPYPVAEVADNDLALGRVADAVSHSPFWASSAIFALEDDSQNGVDHIDGNRGPLEIISPYALHGAVDSHYYTQLNVIRTIEQILGITPMNQKDRAATPMRAAFTSTPDLTPYAAQPNHVALTYGLSQQPTCGSGTSAAPTAAVHSPPQPPPAAADLPERWTDWSEKQHFSGSQATPDYADPERLNRITWYLSHNWRTPYPGDDKLLIPDHVPGTDNAPSDNGG